MLKSLHPKRNSRELNKICNWCNNLLGIMYSPRFLILGIQWTTDSNLKVILKVFVLNKLNLTVYYSRVEFISRKMCRLNFITAVQS